MRENDIGAPPNARPRDKLGAARINHLPSDGHFNSFERVPKTCDGSVLQRVLAEYPKLTRWGFLNLSDPDHGRARAEMVAHFDEFQRACDFIAAGMPGASQGRRRGYESYSMKHRAQEWAGRYVSNGAVIAAALASGWAAKRHGMNAMLKPPLGCR
jgi:hypothetical protein